MGDYGDPEDGYKVSMDVDWNLDAVNSWDASSSSDDPVRQCSKCITMETCISQCSYTQRRTNRLFDHLSNRAPGLGCDWAGKVHSCALFDEWDYALESSTDIATFITVWTA